MLEHEIIGALGCTFALTGPRPERSRAHGVNPRLVHLRHRAGATTIVANPRGRQHCTKPSAPVQGHLAVYAATIPV
jgi:hypothetical protein